MNEYVITIYISSDKTPEAVRAHMRDWYDWTKMPDGIEARDFACEEVYEPSH